MRQLDAASNVGFAFALELDHAFSDDAVGELCWHEETRRIAPSQASAAVTGDLQELFRAIHERQPMRLPCPSGGEVALTWF